MSWQDWPTYSAACQQDVQRLLRKGGVLSAYRANPKYGLGPRHGSWAWKLEREAERVHSVLYVIACANGTVALTAALRALQLDPGGEVITTAFTFSATVGAILNAGLTPVFADVTIPECTLDPKSVDRVKTPRTVAVLPVDLFGQQADYDDWSTSSIQDSCQAVGVEPPEVDCGVWSFQGRKNVPAGEGGAVYVPEDNVDLANQIRREINHAENYECGWSSGNGRMNEVTACIAYHGMKSVQTNNRKRQRLAQRLNEHLQYNSRVITPQLDNHALYIYPLIVDKGMEKVADNLFCDGVVCQRGYIQPPLHRYPAFKEFTSDFLPNTEALSTDRLLLLPQVTPTATLQEMDELGDKLRRALR